MFFLLEDSFVAIGNGYQNQRSFAIAYKPFQTN